MSVSVLLSGQKAGPLTFQLSRRCQFQLQFALLPSPTWTNAERVLLDSSLQVSSHEVWRRDSPSADTSASHAAANSGHQSVTGEAASAKSAAPAALPSATRLRRSCLRRVGPGTVFRVVSLTVALRCTVRLSRGTRSVGSARRRRRPVDTVFRSRLLAPPPPPPPPPPRLGDVSRVAAAPVPTPTRRLAVPSQTSA